MKGKLIMLFFAILAGLLISAANNVIRVPFYISNAEMSTTLRAAADSLEAQYIYPEKGKEMAEAIRKAVSIKAFNNKTPDLFSTEVTSLLFNISGDKHLSFFLQPHLHHDLKKPRQVTLNNFSQEQQKQNNFGIHPVKIIEGQVGYLRMDNMVMPSLAGDRLAKAFDSISNTKAIIIDVRYNGGGEPEMIQTLISHFYPADTLVHINDIYSRRNNRTKQYWTLGKNNGTLPFFHSIVYFDKLIIHFLLRKN